MVLYHLWLMPLKPGERFEAILASCDYRGKSSNSLKSISKTNGQILMTRGSKMVTPQGLYFFHGNIFKKSSTLKPLSLDLSYWVCSVNLWSTTIFNWCLWNQVSALRPYWPLVFYRSNLDLSAAIRTFWSFLIGQTLILVLLLEHSGLF